MLYVREVMDLMGPYPGREFRMIHIVRHVTQGRKLALRERNAARQAILRAIEALCESGVVEKRPPNASRGAPIWYVWKSAT